MTLVEDESEIERDDFGCRWPLHGVAGGEWCEYRQGWGVGASKPAIFGREYRAGISVESCEQPIQQTLSGGAGSDLPGTAWVETTQYDSTAAYDAPDGRARLEARQMLFIPKVALRICDKEGLETFENLVIMGPNADNDEGREPQSGEEPQDWDNNVSDKTKDDDLRKVVLEGPETIGSGTVVVAIPPGFNGFTPSGAMLLPEDLAVSLSSPSGKLAGLKGGAVTIYIEATGTARAGTLSIAQFSADGSERMKESVLLLPVEMMVDANRDREMSFTDAAVHGKDQSTAQKPYCFWINNDYDKGNSVDTDDSANTGQGDQWEEDDYLGDKDRRDDVIEWRRDLEDFTRLWISFKGISRDGEVVLAMTDVDSPKFPNLYEFAQLFRKLSCDDALFLDGDLSQMRSGADVMKPSNNFGSIIAVTENSEVEQFGGGQPATDLESK